VREFWNGGRNDEQHDPANLERGHQQATVLQLPAEPKIVIESEGQQRVAYAG
jgi:hypothetical protein